MIQKQFSEVLEVILTEDEIKQMSEENNKRVLALTRLKADAARVKSAYNSKIKLAEQEIEDTAALIDAGKENRPVECEWRPDLDTYEMRAVRLDTFETIRRRPMDGDERREYLQGKLWDSPLSSDADPKSSEKAVEEFFDGRSTDAPEQIFSVKEQDDFTAARCDECGMIDGGHAPTCSTSPALTYNDYLTYAKATYKSNHASHARKMELRRDPESDAKVRIWLKKNEMKERGATA